MRTRNRPFSDLDVTLNNHNVVKRKDVQKILDKLVKEKKVNIKFYKKFKVYCYNQDLKDKVTEK